MATEKLLNTYLAVGEDALKRQHVIERLHKRLEAFGDLAFNNDVFDGETAVGAEVVSACNTLPFASEVRLVEVRSVEKLHKSDAEAIANYLKQPCESTIVIFSGDKLAKNTKLYKAIATLGSKAIIDCSTMKRQDLVKSLRSLAIGHGFTMTSAACEKLVALVGEDTVRIDTELKKLALAHNGNDPVTDSEVSNLVAQTAEAKPWDFVDAFAARNVARCFHLLPLLGSSSAFYLMAQCQNRIRELLCAKDLERQGRSSELASVLKVQPWRVKNHLRWAHGYSEQELIRALESSRDAERRMKSGADQTKEFVDWFSRVASRG